MSQTINKVSQGTQCITSSKCYGLNQSREEGGGAHVSGKRGVILNGVVREGFTEKTWKKEGDHAVLWGLLYTELYSFQKGMVVP